MIDPEGARAKIMQVREQVRSMVPYDHDKPGLIADLDEAVALLTQLPYEIDPVNPRRVRDRSAGVEYPRQFLCETHGDATWLCDILNRDYESILRKARA